MANVPHTASTTKSRAGHYHVVLRSTEFDDITVRDKFGDLWSARAGVAGLLEELHGKVCARRDRPMHEAICAAAYSTGSAS
jgi:hypothetical protein